MDWKTWKSLLLQGVCFGLLMTGFYQLIQRTGGGGSPMDGQLWIEFLVWVAAGLLVAYTGMRAETYLERKNERWRKRKQEEGSN
ncbi:MAG: hypothetical protein AAGA31_10620 [Bacteroidota bacterium]